MLVLTVEQNVLFLSFLCPRRQWSGSKNSFSAREAMPPLPPHPGRALPLHPTGGLCGPWTLTSQICTPQPLFQAISFSAISQISARTTFWPQTNKQKLQQKKEKKTPPQKKTTNPWVHHAYRNESRNIEWVHHFKPETDSEYFIRACAHRTVLFFMATCCTRESQTINFCKFDF